MVVFIKVIDLIRKYNVKTKKKFGQNFLNDYNIINKIVDTALIDDQTGVIEIGPGLGSLTFSIIQKAKKTLCYEIDENLIRILNKEIKNENAIMINKDFLEVDLEEDIKKYLSDCKRIVVIGNLPYYITTPIIMKLFEIEKIQKYVLMMQKEVGERIVAIPNTKEYGQLSVITQIRAKITKALSVSKNVFIPKPDVESIVLNFDVYSNNPYNISNLNEFIGFVKKCFIQKRKTLLNNLFEAFDLSKDEIAKILIENNYNTNIRAEQLSINDFVKLKQKIEDNFL